MNMKHLQNEKTVEDIINRLSGSHGPDCKKTVEENRNLRADLDSYQQQVKILTDQNQMKDLWLDEIMEKMLETK